MAIYVRETSNATRLTKIKLEYAYINNPERSRPITADEMSTEGISRKIRLNAAET
jgi:hypothetical protein